LEEQALKTNVEYLDMLLWKRKINLFLFASLSCIKVGNTIVKLANFIMPLNIMLLYEMIVKYLVVILYTC
jgi:hypothetical protein